MVCLRYRLGIKGDKQARSSGIQAGVQRITYGDVFEGMRVGEIIKGAVLDKLKVEVLDEAEARGEEENKRVFEEEGATTCD